MVTEPAGCQRNFTLCGRIGLAELLGNRFRGQQVLIKLLKNLVKI